MLPVHRIVVPTPWAVGPVNLYLLGDDPLTLVDAGPRTPEAEKIIATEMEALGYELGDLRRIILTHGHPDHYGLAERLREISGAIVYIHRLEIAKTDMESPYWRQIGEISVQAGMPREALIRFAQVLKEEEAYRRPLTSVIPLQGGERFPIGSTYIEVLHLPGHSAGHVCLYEPQSGIFFSGDHLLKAITPNPTFEPAGEDGLGPAPGREVRRQKSLKQYLESLRKVRGMSVSAVFPAHGDAIDDHVALIDQVMEHHEARSKRVLEVLESADGKPVSPFQLSRIMFPDVRGLEILLALTEVSGHLDLLEEEGKVRVVSGPGGVETFVPA